MKQKIALITLLFPLLFASCQSSYPELDKGLYAEFVTNKGTFVAKLYHEQTPLTVANFVELAEGTHPMVDSTYKGKKYYNGLTFHRVMENFMIQGGDPMATGRGTPGYIFPDEFVDTLKHNRKGILSMANPGPDANGSQFFITLVETPWLDGRHAIFGEIVIGQDIVDSIGLVEVSKPANKPVQDVVMLQVNVINKGVKAPSFKEQMDLIEAKKKEKEAFLQKVADSTYNTWEPLKAKADSLSSGLKIYWHHKTNGTKPKLEAPVKIDYSGYFSDGKLLDTSILSIAKAYDAVDQNRLDKGMYSPMETKYSSDIALIPGFKEGMLQMAYGDKITVFIPAHLAWGERGYPPVIPANADVVFDIEILPQDN